jgi:hypothetical protein
LLFLVIFLFFAAVWQIIREENVVSKVKVLLFRQPESQDVACEYCGGKEKNQR